ncbi:MAG: pyridoxamine 5'-phosphate oxidase family protein, partial [Lentisphaeria bacterium]|nr:pyridoxamine 5'-phosphate oxidase family protein [Lentisphaeria bacterium]
MGAKFPNLETKHIDFIEKQHLFFTGTAGAEGFVNVSPKGLDSFRIIDESTVVWLNLTGSGNETAAHVLENERMTIMFCSFAEQTLILRLYGNATVIHRQDEK